MSRPSIFYAVLILMTGCHSARMVSTSGLKLMEDFCAPVSKENYNQLPPVLKNTDSLLGNQTELAGILTRQDILTANASGTLKLIVELFKLERDTVKFCNEVLLKYTMEIQRNIYLMKSEVDAVSSELDCEVFRTRQLLSYLANLNSNRNTKLTVGAIIVGSLTTVMPVFLTSTASQNIVMISGGVGSAGLGALTLNPGRYELKMMTYRNFLGDIWYGDSTMLVCPPGLWYFLSERNFGNSHNISKAQILKMRWLKFELNNSIDKNTEELLFRNGGVFTQGSLDMRATMLSELIAEINSMNQYLDNLMYDVSNIRLFLLSGLNR